MPSESPHPVIATALKHLIAAGLAGEALVSAIAEIELAQGASRPVAGDATADRRRARDRAYQAEKRRRVSPISSESADSADASPPPNEYLSNPPSPRSSDDDRPPADAPLPERLLAAWNDAAADSGLPP